MHHLNVNIVPHREQRYPTSGDWQFGPDDTLTVTVSDLGDPRFNALVAIHEVVEALLCRERGITDEVVTKFDTDHLELEEPGDDPRAPYHAEHMAASVVEQALAALLGIDWEAYTASFAALEEQEVERQTLLTEGGGTLTTEGGDSLEAERG